MSCRTLDPPQRFSMVLCNAIALAVHAAEVALRPIIALCSSKPILRNSCSVILHNSFFTFIIQHPKQEWQVTRVALAAWVAVRAVCMKLSAAARCFCSG